METLPPLYVPGHTCYEDAPELQEFFLEDVQRTGKRLGSGAFGIVEELTMGGTLLAGKKFHASLLEAQNEGIDRITNRFISECKLMSRIRHPNIVQFMGLCLFGDSPHPALVMEKVDVNMEYILETHSNLPLPVILRILKDITRGLIYLHGQRPPIIHRDLTARNVLINQASMNTKISDLGNSLMVNPMKLSNTLHQAPETVAYMPPEAFFHQPDYDSMLDIFSFGHLALYAVIQQSPGDLLSPTYNDPLTEELRIRSEVERREKYIKILLAKLTKDHVVTKMILHCLNNMPTKRLTALTIMEQLNGVYCDDQDPYEINMIALISTREERDLSHSSSVVKRSDIEPPGIEILKRRIQEFKDGAPGLLDIFRRHGRFKYVWRPHWKSQVFQIKDGCLKYFRSGVNKSPHDELDLAAVVCVKAIPPSKENLSMFHFEVHFTGYKGSPWKMRAYTQDECTCWMEAIKPGSSANHQIDPYSYVDHRVKESMSDSVIYDEPDNISTPQISHLVEEPGPLSAADTEYEPVMPDPSAMPPLTEKPPIQGTSEETKFSLNVYDDTTDHDCYTELPQELYDDVDSDLSENAQASPPPRRNITVPKELELISEVTLESLTNLDVKEAQLWMLLQMQKMVQKMEDVYDMPQASTKHPNPKQNTPKPPSPSKSLPPSSPMSEDVYVDMKPPRQDIYLNLDTIGEVLTETPAPAIPPRTYRTASLAREEIATFREKIQSGSQSFQDNSSQNKQRSKSFSSFHFSQTSGISTENPGPVHQLRSHDATAQQTHASATVVEEQIKQIKLQPIGSRLKRKTSQAEMISTLKARSQAISSEIASHLVTDDDESNIYTPGRRPEWTKAKTRTPGLEPSLADLQQKALFLHRSALHDLKELGQGQYGKVFKGLFKKDEGLGHPVAVKTIKEYESQKEKDNFLKEMNIMSKLIHPNIVRLFGLVKQDKPWIVLEFLPNGDLKHFLIKNKRPVDKLIKYMLDVATGMHYISEKGLVHRDLAARNIMVSKDEICKVGDFGLLRELPKDVDIYVATTKIAFPIRWMAPESLKRKEFSPATDVWSFGIVMWEMFNPNEKPYKDMDNTQVAVSVNQGERLTIPEPYPETVTRIMKACWQHSPSKRPSFLLIASLLTSVCFGTH